MSIQAESPLVRSRPVLTRDRAAQPPKAKPRLPHSTRFAIVNNMPDGALVATERQFSSLVEAAAGRDVAIDLYYLPGLARGAEASTVLEARYRPISDLYHNGADALIVTGNEPRAARLDDEPYWPEMAQLIDWAKDNTASTLWSCLAAHAAILRLDRIERRRMPGKRSGVFACNVARGSGEALPPSLSICHSRLNEAPRQALRDKGYEIVSESADGQVDAFAKTWTSRFLFLQGHPEYETDSLAREHRRDVGRFLNGQRTEYPAVPENYFDGPSLRRLAVFQEQAMAKPAPHLFASYPSIALRQGLAGRLAQSASAVFSMWLNEMVVPGLPR
jgi:homoserine O-succinyltransferase